MFSFFLGGGGAGVGFMCVCDCVCVLMCIVLESLAVHPEYQRLGAGSALVTWGTRAADEKGLTVRHPPPSSLYLTCLPILPIKFPNRKLQTRD